MHSPLSLYAHEFCGQSTQVTASTGAYRPASHMVHSPEPDLANLPALHAVQRLYAHSVPVDLKVREMTRTDNDSQLIAADKWADYVESGRAFGSSSLCMSPAGDTLTSRRTFDALDEKLLARERELIARLPGAVAGRGRRHP